MNIERFVKAIKKQKLHCEGIIVMQHGTQTAEYRWIPEKPRNCHSISKSFVSIAVGMALDRGKLSLDDRVADVFSILASRPEKPRAGKGRLTPDIPSAKTQHGYRPGFATLTMEHLLTMTRGYRRFSRPETVAQALAQRLSYQPGAYFVYDNGSSFLASAMLTHKLRATVREFLLDALFRPLGIPDPKWPESPDGHTLGATGLELTTSSLAVFGQFLLQRGKWKNKQLVSPGWIDNAGRPHVPTPSHARENDYNLGYGYGFWPCRYGAYRADGKDGQFVIVLPRQDAVVAINSSEPKMMPILYTVWDEILPQL